MIRNLNVVQSMLYFIQYPLSIYNQQQFEHYYSSRDLSFDIHFASPNINHVTHALFIITLLFDLQKSPSYHLPYLLFANSFSLLYLKSNSLIHVMFNFNGAIIILNFVMVTIHIVFYSISLSVH